MRIVKLNGYKIFMHSHHYDDGWFVDFDVYIGSIKITDEKTIYSLRTKIVQMIQREIQDENDELELSYKLNR
jgi:hypothetical protein